MSRRRAAGLALLLAWAGLAGWARASKDEEDASRPSGDLQAELAKADGENLENTLEHAGGELAKTHAQLKETFAFAAVEIKAGQVRLVSVLADPWGFKGAPPEQGGRVMTRVKESEQALSLAVELLPEKSAAYAKKAAAASPAIAAAETAPKAQGVRPKKDREADLKRLKADLKRAEARWGTKDLKPAQQEAVDALQDCLSELLAAADQAEAADGALVTAEDKRLGEPASRLRARAVEAAREAELLKGQLLLARYDEDRRSGGQHAAVP